MLYIITILKLPASPFPILLRALTVFDVLSSLHMLMCSESLPDIFGLSTENYLFFSCL